MNNPTDFLTAAREGDLEKVKALLKDNADLVFSKDNYGQTPLHYAAAAGQQEVAELLLARKGEVSAKANDGDTPLHLAATEGHKDVVKLLLASKADVTARANDGTMPLHLAAAEGHKDVVELLLAYKAEVNVRDGGGSAPLDYAAAKGHEDLVELLRQQSGHLPRGSELTEDVRANMDTKSTEELVHIWKKHNTQVWTAEELEAVHEILTSRGESEPPVEARMQPPTAKPLAAGKSVELCLANGERVRYDNLGKLRRDIVLGKVTRDIRARLVTESGEPNKGQGKAKQVPWSTLEKVSATDFSLHTLYKPVWAHTMKYMAGGAVVGIVLKALDTTVLLVRVNSDLGLMWLLFLASFVASNWWKWAWVVALAISVKAGTNLWSAFLAVMFVGALLGAPAGMVVGTVVGHFKQNSVLAAPDSVCEGRRPYVLGLVAPLIFLLVAVPLYALWLSPLAVEWLAKHP